MKTNFKSGNKTTFESHWQLLRKYQPNGPLVNSEFYPGWFTHWQEPPGKVDPAPVAESLRYVFQYSFISLFNSKSVDFFSG